MPGIQSITIIEDSNAFVSPIKQSVLEILKCLFSGPAVLHETRALLLFAPNNSDGMSIMNSFARSVSCPDNPAKRNHYSNSFYELFRQTVAAPECSEQQSCLSNPACASHLSGKSSTL